MHDEDNCKYVSKNSVIHLAPLENIALTLLIKNKGKITTKEMICRALYGFELDMFLECRISSLMYRLKKKLGGECKIISKREHGYFIELEERIKNEK